MAMKRVYRDGRVLNQRTLNMLECAEKRLGYKLVVTQGSYNAGGVAASAGTHDGGGAFDLSINGYSPSQVDEVILHLRQVGFAAWHRTVAQGGGSWSTAHIHAIAIGDAELSYGAKSQVSDYYARKNGLASHATDDGPWLDPIPTWRIDFPRVWSFVVINQSKNKNPVEKVSVRRIQAALKGRGYYDAAVDGVFGPKTHKAWDAFVTRRKLVKDVTRANIRVLCAGYNRVV